jgi:hypothetical protein
MPDAALASRLELGDHICWTYADDSARQDALAQVASAGRAAGHKVLSFTGAVARATYVPDGTFDPYRTLETCAQLVDETRDQGLSIVADMSWAAAHPRGVDRLAWYEAEATRFYAAGTALAVCLYDRRLFTDEQVRDVCCAHPGTAWGHDDPGDEWLPLLRIRRLDRPRALRLIGEADLTNRRALAAVLERERPSYVDVSRLRFADAAAGALIRSTGAHVEGARGSVALVLSHFG